MNIIPKKWHSSWDNFMTEDIIKMLTIINDEIGNDFVPEEQNVLRFLKQDLSSVKCIWLGQDPYYTMYKNDEYVANGRSFQPNNLISWNDSFSQKALQNIIRLIHKTYTDTKVYEDIKKYSEIRNEINSNSFTILQPYEWFDSLENQGVLFLNTYFTTIKGTPKCHRKIWLEFSKQLIKYISETNLNINWFLWGDESASMKEFIKDGVIHICNHPTFCSSKKDNDFLKSNCFKDTMNIINWLGEK